ncbi:MAG: DUF4177 domain-containing protein [Treponema sp.]|nr:DUF4177 domain-containing protein [Treponema sp.]
MEITKWEYMDLRSYKSSNYKPNMWGTYKDADGNEMKSDTEILNDLGKKGWEVVGCPVSGCNGSISSNFLLKRPCGRLQVIEKVNGVPINSD